MQLFLLTLIQDTCLKTASIVGLPDDCLPYSYLVFTNLNEIFHQLKA